MQASTSTLLQFNASKHQYFTSIQCKQAPVHQDKTITGTSMQKQTKMDTRMIKADNNKYRD
jgi:hypothetical protein